MLRAPWSRADISHSELSAPTQPVPSRSEDPFSADDFRRVTAERICEMGSVATRPRNRNRNHHAPRTPAPPGGADQAAARAVGAAAVGGVALIHFVDLFDKFKETPYVGVLYLGLIAGCLWAARRLVLVGDTPGWLV